MRINTGINAYKYTNTAMKARECLIFGRGSICPALFDENDLCCYLAQLRLGMLIVDTTNN